ncbi:MAG: hypothetical protein Q9222_004477 [Ikaeria aurantiellina]
MNQITGTALITGVRYAGLDQHYSLTKTQAAGGIGEETVFAFAEAGVSAIAVADLNVSKAKEVAEKSKSLAANPDYRTVVIHVDVTNPESVQQMVDTTMKELGRIDYNVNAAGIDNDYYEPAYNSTVEEYDKVMDINAKGVLTCVRAVSKAMVSQEPRSVKTRSGTRDIGRGSIVNLASACSYAALPGKVAYVASKHAVMGITKTAALDCAAKGVRVNAVCPTWVRTPMYKEECSKNPQHEDLVKSLSPVGRAAEPDEVSGIVLALSAPFSSYVTGTGLLIDGGLTLTVHIS